VLSHQFGGFTAAILLSGILTPENHVELLLVAIWSTEPMFRGKRFAPWLSLVTSMFGCEAKFSDPSSSLLDRGLRSISKRYRHYGL